MVIADPRNCRRKRMEALRALKDIPVVVERPRLRPDLVADAARAGEAVPAAMVVVECAASAAELDGVITDGFALGAGLRGRPA